MKTPILSSLLLLSCLASPCFGQSSANAGGGDSSDTGGSVAFSVGEVVYTQVVSIGGQSNQGVQHAYDSYVGIEEGSSLDAVLSLFPNPASTTVTLDIADLASGSYTYSLFDMTGKTLEVRAAQAGQNPIDIRGLASGTYLLNVQKETGGQKSFRLVIVH